MPKTKKTKSKSKSAWFELIQQKEDFKNIVSILNRYYDLQASANHPSLAHLFRQEIVKSETANLRIFLKKFGSFEFLVVVEISSDSGKKMDSWIHIDGITQERIHLKQKGKLEHPVFRITSLEDLFQLHSKEVKKGFEPKIEDLVAL